MNAANRPKHSAYSPSLANLRSLLAIRAIALLGQAGVLAYVLLVSRTTQSLWGMAASLVLLAVITVASLWWSTTAQDIGNRTFFAQLMVDVLGWSALMYYSGGADNPFISYYIVPLVVAAAVLPWRYTWLVAAASVAAYSLLLYFRVPFPLFSPHAAMGHQQGSVHSLGMWFNFLFSAGLITYFVVRMAAVLREQEAEEMRRREDRLRHDQILAVASLAAGTAHELGTPLGTMTLLAEELQQDASLGDQAREDIALMQQQLLQCRKILAELSNTAEVSAAGTRQRRQADRLAKSCVEHWAARRPRVSCQLQVLGQGPAPQVSYDQTLPQALENLLNNAADTGAERVEVTVDWNADTVSIGVRDNGPGAPADVLAGMSATAPPVSAAGPGANAAGRTHGGLGIGLLLARATAERHGGHVRLENPADGGCLATLTMPAEPAGG
ncbi:MAG: ATP-binding protein [Haliea sp.]|uniref:ATP-binding protein n=1 Tax=Haliea sp. TaxID=1932666 RepID=UPI000C503749|nr:ATP-binding protein [Haliea sp.]MBM69509.1 ATP-binding protein [Haliea sp.]